MFIQDSPSWIMARATLRVRQLWEVDDSKGGPCRGRVTTGLAEHLHMRLYVNRHVRVSTDNSRRVVEGIVYRYRTGIAWRDLPREEFGPWQTVWKRHRRYAADGT